MAEFLRVHPTFVSQVVNGPKDFSGEQAVMVAEFLTLVGREKSYFLELIFFARAGHKNLREYHKQRMKELRSESNKVANRVGKSKELSDDQKIRYYSDWSYVATWLGTSIDSLSNVPTLAKFFNLAPSQVSEILDFLKEAGLCKEVNGVIEMKVKKTHIPANSILVKNHHLNWRLKSIESGQKLSASE